MRKKILIKWLEVIMARSVVRNSNVMASTFRELMNDLANDAEHEASRISRREKLDSDICIVLFHEGKKTKTVGSPLCQRLVAPCPFLKKT